MLLLIGKRKSDKNNFFAEKKTDFALLTQLYIEHSLPSTMSKSSYRPSDIAIEKGNIMTNFCKGITNTTGDNSPFIVKFFERFINPKSDLQLAISTLLCHADIDITHQMLADESRTDADNHIFPVDPSNFRLLIDNITICVALCLTIIQNIYDTEVIYIPRNFKDESHIDKLIYKNTPSINAILFSIDENYELLNCVNGTCPYTSDSGKTASTFVAMMYLIIKNIVTGIRDIYQDQPRCHKIVNNYRKHNRKERRRMVGPDKQFHLVSVRDNNIIVDCEIHELFFESYENTAN